MILLASYFLNYFVYFSCSFLCIILKLFTHISIILCCLAFVCSVGVAQNLIPNGDFELGPDSSSTGWIAWDDTTCTDVLPMNGPNFWTVISGSPDRMVEGGVFTCNWDNDTAQSGKAWVDFGWIDEAGKTTLINPIEVDSTYLLSGYIKMETFQGTWFQPTRVAFVFNNGTDSIVSPYTNSQWQYFDTLFIASANSTEIKVHSIEMVGSATKVDNISLQKVSSTYINDISSLKKLITIYPNPTKDILNIKSPFEIYEIEILDLFGRSLLVTTTSPINITQINSGNYLLKLTTKKNIIIKKLSIIN